MTEVCLLTIATQTIPDYDHVRDVEHVDLAIDPPPYLVAEVDIASSSSNRLSTYAALGVPEVWRYNNNALSILTIIDGNDVDIEASRIIRGLPAIEVAAAFRAAASPTPRTRDSLELAAAATRTSSATDAGVSKNDRRRR